jgi:hypothetical protein
MNSKHLVYCLGASMLAAAVFVPACSLYVRDEAVQCKTDEDCSSRGPDFVETGCASAGPSKGFCIDRRSLRVNGECAANADCVDITGPGSVCTIGDDSLARCVRVVTEECPTYVGDPFIEGTALYGLLGEISPEDTGFAQDFPLLAAADLAVNEFQSDRALELNGKRRIAIIGCSESKPRTAAAHLAQLGVKAVIGPSAESRLLRVAEQLSPRGIPLFTGHVGQNAAATLPASNKLVFLTAPTRDGWLAALNAYLPEASADVKAARTLPNVRVTVVVGPELSVYAPLIRERLSFNGKTAIENQNDAACGNCFQLVETSGKTDAQIADEVGAFGPQFIVPLVDTSWGASMLPAFEARFTGPQAGRPIYIHPMVRDEDLGYRQLNWAEAAVRARFVGLWAERDEGVLASFRERYRQRTSPSEGQVGITPTTRAIRTYENMLLVLYASYAAGRGSEAGEFNGRALAAAVSDVTAAGAQTIGPGPLSMLDAILALNKSDGAMPKPTYGKIDFNGLYTQFEFGADQAVSNRVQVFCLNASGQYVGSARVLRNGQSFEGGTPGLCR